MFTGLVQAIGEVRAAEHSDKGAQLRLTVPFDSLVLGESIAVQGACLTVKEVLRDGFVADASAETLRLTTLGTLRAGSRVHLERALRLGDAVGGHLVTGHVDGMGKVVGREALGEALKVEYEAPEALAPLIAPKGSIAVDGTSLTVNGARGRRFDVVLVPYTRKETLLDARPIGAPVNLEVDPLAKYVARLLGRPGVDGQPPGEGLTLEKLAQEGYVTRPA